jgi:hypothetical protein
MCLGVHGVDGIAKNTDVDMANATQGDYDLSLGTCF